MRITTVDGHVAGGAVRLVTGGLPTVTGDSVAARAEALAGASGSVLQSLAREPRGHAGTVVAVFVEPERPEADAGLVFLRGRGRVDFEGHGLIGATALALDAKLLQPRRPGRVLVDTGRNGWSATFAAAYTVRARPGAPVSAPCTWDEVERGEVAPRSFTLQSLSARLATVGDLWADLLTAGQSLREPVDRLAHR